MCYICDRRFADRSNMTRHTDGCRKRQEKISSKRSGGSVGTYTASPSSSVSKASENAALLHRKNMERATAANRSVSNLNSLSTRQRKVARKGRRESNSSSHGEGNSGDEIVVGPPSYPYGGSEVHHPHARHVMPMSHIHPHAHAHSHPHPHTHPHGHPMSHMIPYHHPMNHGMVDPMAAAHMAYFPLYHHHMQSMHEDAHHMMTLHSQPHPSHTQQPHMSSHSHHVEQSPHEQIVPTSSTTLPQTGGVSDTLPPVVHPVHPELKLEKASTDAEALKEVPSAVIDGGGQRFQCDLCDFQSNLYDEYCEHIASLH